MILMSIMSQVGQSFKVAGEEYEAPPEERVEIVDDKVKLREFCA